MQQDRPRTIDALERELPRILQVSPRHVLLVVGVLFGLYVLSSFHYVGHLERALPAALVTDGAVAYGDDRPFLAALMPIRHEPCGGVAFQLSRTTVGSIEAQGIKFFHNVRQGRGVQEFGDRIAHEFNYAPWQPTPLPYEWTRNVAWRGLDCTGWVPSAFGTKILTEVEQAGSYYTTAPSKLLLVLPRIKMLVLTYSY